MLQGAIDMVQMDLKEQDWQSNLLRLKEYCRKFKPPRRLDVPLLAAVQANESQQAHHPASTLAISKYLTAAIPIYLPDCIVNRRTALKCSQLIPSLA